MEKFLSEYRSLAYDICYRRNSGNQSLDTKPWIIGEHTFPSLTEEFCSRPYIDLPHTLSAKDRRKIHTLCAHTMDLYHAGVGQKSKRRIVVSIYADGFRFIPDEDLESSSLCSNNATSRFPHKMCTPWYYLDTNTNAKRLAEIEEEKKLIHQFVKYPEQSLITKSYEALVVLAELENLDLSNLPSVDQTPYDIVDTVDKLRLCIEELKHGVGYDSYTNNLTTILHELAFDMEMHNQNNTVRTCLIQITANTVQKDYIIDPLAAGMWDSISIHLGPLFSDPSILKIGHGIGGMDCSSLHRDFGILVVNAFDTCEASAIIRQSKGGMNLATLCGHYNLPACEHYRNLKDRFQTANWCQRPLPIEALEYGRYDVRYLITLKKLLTRDLLKLDMVAGVFNDVSEYDSTSVSERINTDETGEHFISSSSEWSSSISDLSVGIDKVRTEAIITVSDLPCFEKLMKAISISQKRCLKIWNGKDEESESILRNQSFTSLVKQSASVEKRCGVWTEQNTKLYKKLADWRAIVAERENIDVSDVCSLDMLGKLLHNASNLSVLILTSYIPRQSTLHINHRRTDQNFGVLITHCLH